jgi:hypothetical protein
VALEQTMEMVVEHMQVLDQQIPAVTVCRRCADQSAHLGARFVAGLTAFELRAGLTQLRSQRVQTDTGFRNGIGLHAKGSHPLKKFIVAMMEWTMSGLKPPTYKLAHWPLVDRRLQPRHDREAHSCCLDQ